jgi:flagellar hook-associated protein 1 FlgK
MPGGGSFSVSSDTAGLMAGLGVNNFFSGNSAETMGIKTDLMQDVSLINHGTVNANGQVEEGDNSTAIALAKLANEAVKISTSWEYATQSLIAYHATIVSGVGADMRTTKFNAEYNTTLAEELDARVSGISGVNLDEEMTNLIKFQHSYTAAAKLITTADQMLQTILSLKQ